MTVSLIKFTASSNPGRMAIISFTSALRLTVSFPSTFLPAFPPVRAGFSAPSIESHTLPFTPSSSGRPSMVRSSLLSRSSPARGSSLSVVYTVARHCMNSNGSNCTRQVVSSSFSRRDSSGNVTPMMRSPSLMYVEKSSVSSSSLMVRVMDRLLRHALRTSHRVSVETRPAERGGAEGLNARAPPRNGERRAEAVEAVAAVAHRAVQLVVAMPRAPREWPRNEPRSGCHAAESSIRPS